MQAPWNLWLVSIEDTRKENPGEQQFATLLQGTPFVRSLFPDPSSWYFDTHWLTASLREETKPIFF